MHYALPLPLPPPSSSSLSSPSSSTAPDPRAHGMLRALAARAVGDPFVRPSGAEEEDERVELGRSRCVVEWSARGVGALDAGSAGARGAEGKGKAVAAARERARERDRVAKGEVPRVVKWGMCGAALGGGGAGEEGATVREVGVWEVVDPAAGRAQVRPLFLRCARAPPDLSFASLAALSPPLSRAFGTFYRPTILSPCTTSPRPLVRRVALPAHLLPLRHAHALAARRARRRPEPVRAGQPAHLRPGGVRRARLAGRAGAARGRGGGRKRGRGRDRLHAGSGRRLGRGGPGWGS